MTWAKPNQSQLRILEAKPPKPSTKQAWMPLNFFTIPRGIFLSPHTRQEF